MVWSPVWRFHIFLIWGAIASAGAGLLGLIKSRVNATIYQDVLSSSCILSLQWTSSSFSSRTLDLFTLPNSKTWFSDHVISGLNLAANWVDLNLVENLWGFAKRKIKDMRPNNEASSAVPQADSIHSSPDWGSNWGKRPKPNTLYICMIIFFRGLKFLHLSLFHWFHVIVNFIWV